MRRFNYKLRIPFCLKDAEFCQGTHIYATVEPPLAAPPLEACLPHRGLSSPPFLQMLALSTRLDIYP